jgi:hypothetical protein
VYNLPFGHDRSHGKDANWFLASVFGDWDLSGIISVQSGLPITINRTSVNTGQAVSNGQSAALSNPTISQWFNTGTFSLSPAFTYGNVGPVLPDVFTNGTRNVDTVLVKNFAFSIEDHKITAQFRSEFYNLFNHPLFASPNGTITSQSFGVVSSQANNPRDIQFGLKIVF